MREEQEGHCHSEIVRWDVGCMHMLSRQVIPRAVQAGETRNTGVGVGSQRKGWTEKSILETDLD